MRRRKRRSSRGLLTELFPTEPGSAESEERIDQWFVQAKRERPGYRLDRLIGSVRQSYDERVFQTVMDRLDEPMRGKLDALLEDTGDGSPLLDLRPDPGRVGLERILEEVAKLERLRTLALPADVLRSFGGVDQTVSAACSNGEPLGTAPSSRSNSPAAIEAHERSGWRLSKFGVDNG